MARPSWLCCRIGLLVGGDLRGLGLFTGATQGIGRAVVRMLAAKRYGALFAIERRSDLTPYLETGVEIEAEFSWELVLTIFHPKTALHDGGMILRQDTFPPSSSTRFAVSIT